ncbi:MAG: protein kinase, partial [Myxococcales bacterium]|nr:protein kinase [Myxococcales bacterium]
MTQPLPRSADLASGPVQFGKYTLVRAIGHGGMATVYLAFKTMGTTKKAVALKVSNDFVGLDPKRREGILNEIRIGGRMRHSNIVSVMDAGEYGGVVFIELELIDGHDLRQFVEDLARRDQQLPFAIIAYILRGILEGLNYAHVDFTVDGVSQQVVHRDLTPSNIILSTSGEVKIIDFGIGKYFDEHTSGAYLKGKPRYMAPEHAAGSSSPSIDIFPVGAILYELIEGRRFREDFPSADLYAVAAGGYVPELRRADVPEAFCGLYRALVEADPYRRVHSAAAAMAMLDLWEGRPAQASELRAVVRVHTGGTHSGYTQGEFVIPEGLEAAVAIANAREQAVRGAPTPAVTPARGRPEPTEDAPRGGHGPQVATPVAAVRIDAPPVAPAEPDAPHSPRWGRVITPAAARAPANDGEPTAVEPRPMPWPPAVDDGVAPIGVAGVGPTSMDRTETLAPPEFVRATWSVDAAGLEAPAAAPRPSGAEDTVFVVTSRRVRPWHVAVGLAVVLALSLGVGMLLA